MMRISRHGISFFASSSTTTIRLYSSNHYNTSIGLNSNIENVKCLDDAVTLFHQMVRMNPLPHVISFSKLFKTILNMKHYSAVISLFREMRKLGIPINDSILNIVINNYCLMHRADCAFSVLPIYLKNGILNVITFNTLLRGIFAENKVKDAVELFKKLVREKICGATIATHRIGTRVQPTFQESNLNPSFKYVCWIILTGSLSLNLVLSAAYTRICLLVKRHLIACNIISKFSVLVALDLECMSFKMIYHFCLQVQNSYGAIYVVQSSFQQYGAFSDLREARTTGLLALSICQFMNPNLEEKVL